jgi:hypothetical protein
MRTRLEGTQASGEGESHTQEANVAEVNYGEPNMANPSIQQAWNHPAVSDSGLRPSNAPDKHVTNGVVEASREMKFLDPSTLRVQ